MEIQQILLTVLISTIGAIIVYRLKCPGGLLIGSIVFSAAYSVFTQNAYMAPWIKVVAQTITGAYIGSLATREDVTHLPKIIRPVIEAMLAFLAINLLAGYVIWLVSPMDLASALLGCMPGGVSDSVLIAMDMDADVTKVAVMQLTRLFFGIGMLPFIVRYANSLVSHHEGTDHSCTETAVPAREKRSVPRRQWIISTVLVAAAGTTGKLSGIPAGTMLFAMIAMMTIRLKFFEYVAPPQKLRRVAQILIGACVGSAVTQKEVAELPHVIIPLIIMMLTFSVVSLVMGLRFHKKYGFEFREAMLCLSPSGVTEMALIAADMGVNSTNLVVVQVSRMVFVMSLFPQIIAFLA